MKNFFSDFFEKNRKLSLALLLFPLLLYKKSLSFGFSPMDEQWLIEDNAAFLGSWASIKTAFTSPSAFVFYRPVFMISLIVDYHFGKLGPFFYHFSNLLFHMGSVLLLFRFLLQMDVNKRRAFALSLLFAAHPVMLHAVAWIPGRNDSLLCIFVLSSFIFLNKYLAGNSIRNLAVHLLFFIGALFTKESAIVLPLVFFFICFFHQNADKKRVVVFSGVWLSIALIWFLLRTSVVDYFPKMEGDVVTSIKQIFLALIVFTGKTIFPVQQSVFPTLKNSSLVPGIITLVFFVFFWFAFKPKNKQLAFLGLFIFFIFMLIPIAFGVLKSPGEQYEHRIYTSMLGLVLFVSQLQFKLNSRVMTGIFVSLLGILSAKTFLRMDVYKNEFSFLEAGIKESPDYYFFHLSKGDLLYRNKDYANALSAFNKAIELYPTRPQSYNNRANVYMALGRTKEAIVDYTKALDKTGTNAAVLSQRCIAYYTAGDIENAMKDLSTLKKCCQEQVHPDMEKTLTGLWEIELWNRKINADPKSALLYVERARFFMQKRMGKEALADLQKACELEPGNKTYRGYYNELATSLPK